MDFPFYLDCVDFWAETPPVWMLGSLLLSALGGNKAQKRTAPELSDQDMKGRAQMFAQEFAQGMGGNIRRVSKTYYDDVMQGITDSTNRYRTAKGLPPDDLRVRST